MLFPFLVVLPGLIALSVRPVEDKSTPRITSATAVVERAPVGVLPYKVNASTGEPIVDSGGKPQLDYDLTIPTLLLRYFPAGMLGLGLTALLASFMSGMAGNVTAFNTVWTYDIYQAYLRPRATDAHYLWIGRMATVFGIAASVLTAYVAAQFNNIMDVLQLVFAFVNAPLLATFLLGMFWKRATGHGAFAGLVAGTCAAALHHGLTLPAGAAAGVKGGWLGDDPRIPERDGAEFLDGHRCLDGLFSGDDRGQPGHAAAGRQSFAWARVFAHRPSGRRAPAMVPPADGPGWVCAARDCRAQRGVFLMRLDVRLPAGLMFLTIGALLAGYGFFGDRAIYARSLGINVNLIWGTALLVVGGALLALAARSPRGRP